MCLHHALYHTHRVRTARLNAGCRLSRPAATLLHAMLIAATWLATDMQPSGTRYAPRTQGLTARPLLHASRCTGEVRWGPNNHRQAGQVLGLTCVLEHGIHRECIQHSKLWQRPGVCQRATVHQRTHHLDIGQEGQRDAHIGPAEYLMVLMKQEWHPTVDQYS